MIYIIAILLLVLVLANDTARGLLGLLIVGAVALAIIGGILFGVVILVLWLLESKKSTNIAAPLTAPPPVSASPPGPMTELFVGIFIVAAIVIIIVDQYRLRKK